MSSLGSRGLKPMTVLVEWELLFEVDILAHPMIYCRYKHNLK